MPAPKAVNELIEEMIVYRPDIYYNIILFNMGTKNSILQ